MRSKDNPRQNANFLSKLLFVWMWPLFKRGFTNDLVVEDMGKPLDEDLSHNVSEKLERNWFQELQSSKNLNKKPKLLRALIKTFISQYIIDGILVFLQYAGCKSFQPLLLAKLLNHLATNNHQSQKMAAIYAGGVISLSLGSVFLQHHTTLRQQQLGMRVRIACCSLVYRKMMRMSSESFTHITAGHVVNLMSNDVNRFDSVLKFLHIIWVVPIQIVLCCYIYSQNVSLVALIGILAIFLQTLPVQSYISRVLGKFRLKIARKTDERVRLMDEIICGIHVIKMYAWEKPFAKAVSIARKNEMKFLKRVSCLRAINASVYMFAERFSLFITLLGHVLLGYSVTASTVYSLSQFYNMLLTMLAHLYPNAITSAAECLASIRRIQEFLVMEEKDAPIFILDSDAKMKSNMLQSKRSEFINNMKKNESEEAIGGFVNYSYEDNCDTTNEIDKNDSNIESNPDQHIDIRNLTASWVKECNESQATLRDINLQIDKSKLVAVIGSVGSGKSSLFHLILKELTPQKGSIYVNGSISYASQEPWLFADTIRNNILFGMSFDYKKYKSIVRACALEKDFIQLPQGDHTLVGERGVSLSGGQKSRINLARAIYRDADIYLIDDPLSGLDAYVGNYVFQECFKRYLRGKTCILATHQMHILKSVDSVIVMNNGVIETIGTYEELLKSKQNSVNFQTSAPIQQEVDDNVFFATNSIREISRRISVASTVKSDYEEDENPIKEKSFEEKSTGLMGWNIYWRYWKSGKQIFLLIFVATILLCSQISASSNDYWVTYWTNQYFDKSPDTPYDVSNKNFSYLNIEENIALNSTKPLKLKSLTDSLRQLIGPLSSMQYIYIYTFLILLCFVLSIIGCLIFFVACMKSSQGLHTQMFNTILKAPMQFYDTNPSGRILNRFSKDLGIVDEYLPKDMLETIQILMSMLSTLIMVSMTNIWLLLLIVIIILCFFFLLSIYLRTAQDIRRIESITRSPVYSHACTTVKGIATIRSSNAQMRLTKEFDFYQDIHTASWYQFLASRSTFCFWLDLTGILFVSGVTFSFIFYRNGKWLSGDVGLAISQSLSFTAILQFGIRQLTEVISHLTSVERMLQYTDINQEKGLENGNKVTPDNWPPSGSLTMKNVYLSYSEKEKPVLENLNIHIKSGWKIGIVGRTGAGKSSLIAALFRLADVQGNIIIDGIEISDISLQELRSKISIIPQEPILFSSSIRYNLDPFNQFNDADLWDVLETVYLKDSIPSLDFQILEGGQNFSLGQRQLICLARAILKNNRILVLDEATASMDPQTDSFIQDIIRKKFSHCTILTIAHRLNTIMDADRILVLDCGKTIEYDYPFLLLQNPNSLFSLMVRENGQAESLFAIAESSFRQKSSKREHQNNRNRNVEDVESISYRSMSDKCDK